MTSSEPAPPQYCLFELGFETLFDHCTFTANLQGASATQTVVLPDFYRFAHEYHEYPRVSSFLSTVEPSSLCGRRPLLNLALPGRQLIQSCANVRAPAPSLIKSLPGGSGAAGDFGCLNHLQVLHFAHGWQQLPAVEIYDYWTPYFRKPR